MTAKRVEDDSPDTLGISLQTLAVIILEARSYDAQSSVSGLEEGSNPTDDRDVSALEGRRDNPARAQLHAAIAALGQDEQVALVALAWLGRGDFAADEWEQAKTLAQERRTGGTARYLMGMPQLGDYLEEGAAALGFNLSEAEGSILG